jgi:hypothetical protein
VVSLLPSPLAPTGGVFRLDRKLATDISRSIAGGWLAFAHSDGQHLIVSGPQGAANYETAVEDTISAAFRAAHRVPPAASANSVLTGMSIMYVRCNSDLTLEPQPRLSICHGPCRA